MKHGRAALVALALAAVAGTWGCSPPSGPDADADGDADGDAELDTDLDLEPDGPGDGDLDEPEASLPGRAVTGSQPGHGPWVGGTAAVVRGRGFTEGVEVRFGARPVDEPDLTVVDDNRIAVLTPPGEVGPVDLTVTWPDGEARTLREGFVYDSWYLDPSSGSTAGGTLVRVLGVEGAFEDGSIVEIGGASATDVVVASSSEVLCRTPPGAVGAADVSIVGVGGTQTVRDAFVYFDSSDPVNGGLGGGPIEGTVDVTVLEDATRRPLPGTFVILGDDPATPFQGFTDADGKITFSDPGLAGRQTVTAAHEPVMVYDDRGEPLGEMVFETTTIVAFDARNVTIFLVALPPPQPGPPPPGRRGGFIDGELLFDSRGEFGPYEWDAIPGPIPPYEVKAAFVYTSQGSVWSSRMEPGSEGTVFDTSEYRGVNGYRFRIYSRPGAVAVYALAGILNLETGAFQPYVMGVVRGLVVGPDETVSNVHVYMSRQLATSLTVLLEDAPAADETGTPNSYSVEVFIDLGAEGAIGRPETSRTSGSTTRPFHFPGWTELTGNLADASYTVVAGAWTVRPGSTEQANPWSVVIRSGLTDLDSDVVIDSFLGVPRPVTPEPGGVVSAGRMEWAADLATPDFSWASLTIPGGIVPVPYWTVILRGGTTAYELPDLSALAGMPEPPASDVSWQVWSFSVRDLDFDQWSYRYFGQRYWTAYAADGWFVRLRDGLDR